MSAHFATVAAVLFSLGTVLGCILFFPMLWRQLSMINSEIESDMAEFNFLAENAWSEIKDKKDKLEQQEPPEPPKPKAPKGPPIKSGTLRNVRKVSPVGPIKGKGESTGRGDLPGEKNGKIGHCQSKFGPVGPDGNNKDCDIGTYSSIPFSPRQLENRGHKEVLRPWDK